MHLLKKLPAPLVALAIWFLSAQNTLPLPDMGLTFTDKIAHFIAYAVLAFACALWLPHDAWTASRWRAALPVVLVTAFYGLLDEFHQSFVPGRDCSPFDWLADLAGAIIGVSLYILVSKLKHGGDRLKTKR